MKKTVLILLMLAPILSYAQRGIVSYALSTGCTYTSHPEVFGFAVGANITIGDVYLDTHIKPAINRDKATKVASWHIGYRFGIKDDLAIIPIIGKTVCSEGVLKINNEHLLEEWYHPKTINSFYDVGAVFELRNFDGSKFNFGITTHSIFIGCGVYIYNKIINKPYY